MLTLMRRISIAFAILTFVIPLSYAGEMGNGESGSYRLGRDGPESSKRDTLDGASVGFGLGSLMSSGNAQQAVNQEGRREETDKQEKARKRVQAKEFSNKTSSKSSEGTTASGNNQARSPSRQVPDSW